MKLNIILLFLSLFTGLVATPAAAENQIVAARYVNLVQDKQKKSIDEGVKIGKLTPKEARKLRKEQKNIKRLERDMRENGLDQHEIKILFARLEKSRNNINRLLRNNISSYGEIEPLESSANGSDEIQT